MISLPLWTGGVTESPTILTSSGLLMVRNSSAIALRGAVGVSIPTSWRRLKGIIRVPSPAATGSGLACTAALADSVASIPADAACDASPARCTLLSGSDAMPELPPPERGAFSDFSLLRDLIAFSMMLTVDSSYRPATLCFFDLFHCLLAVATRQTTCPALQPLREMRQVKMQSNSKKPQSRDARVASCRSVNLTSPIRARGDR